MRETPYFSIVIPSYQCAPYLQQCITSALHQTYPRENYEIIVVDDGSTDDTNVVLQPFLHEIRYVRREHRGIGAARNEGIALAKGSHIAFLDADDYWMPKRLERVADLLKANPVSFAVTDFLFMRDGVLPTIGYLHSRGFDSRFLLDAGAQFELALEGNFLSGMTIIPKEIVDKVGGCDELLTFGIDWDLSLRVLAIGLPVRWVAEPLWVYRYLRPGSTTTRFDAEMARSRVRLLSKHKELVSLRSWAMARGIADHMTLREAMSKREFLEIANCAGKLSLNGIYLANRIRARLARLSK